MNRARDEITASLARDRQRRRWFRRFWEYSFSRAKTRARLRSIVRLSTHTEDVYTPLLSPYALKEYLPRSLWWIAPCPKQRPRRAACHLAHSPDLGLDPIVTIVCAASTSTRSTRRSRVTIVARAPLISITRVAMSRVAAVTREAPPRADADADRSRPRRRVRTSSRAAGTSTRWRRALSTTSALALLFAVAARAQAVRWVRARLKFKRDEISF